MRIVFRLILLSFVITPHLAAQDLERTVASMAKINFANSPSFSPDGSRVAYLANISGSPQVWIVSSEGGYPKAATSFDDPVSAVAWSPRGNELAITVAPGGGLNTQIWLMTAEGTNLRRITPGGKENNWLGVWSRDGKYLTYSSNARSGESMDAMMYDVASGKSKKIVENRGIGTVDDVSPDGKYVLVNRVASRGDNDVFRVDITSGKEILVTPHKPPGSFYAEFGADASTIYLQSDASSDLPVFGRVKIVDGVVKPIQIISQRNDAELDGFDVDPMGHHALLFWNVAGRTEMEYVDLRNGKSIARPKLVGDIVAGGDFSDDGKKIVLTAAGANVPSNLHVWEAGSSKSARQITQSSHAGVDLSALQQPELLRYEAHDGIELSGWLYRPAKSGKSLPVVFSFHGGPEGQERPGLNSTYQALLTRGIAVFAPNVRGSSGFGKKFVNLDNGALRVNGVKDIESSVKVLVDQGIADPKRLGIMGGSYGGYMVMAGMTEYPDMFAAGANLFGVVNFETFFKHSEPWMAEISMIEYGNPNTEAEMLRKLSPIHKLDRLKGALLVLHGANDTNVPVIEAEQIVDTLKSRNVPVEYVLFPDEGHGWRKTPNRVRSALTIVKFFEKHLRP